MPLMGVLAALHGLVGPSFHVFLDILLKALAAMSDAQTDAIFTTRSAHDLMWGYEDALLVRLKEVLPADSVPTTRFGLFVNQSSPEEALAQPPQIIYTGAHDLRRTWEVCACTHCCNSHKSLESRVSTLAV